MKKGIELDNRHSICTIIPGILLSIVQ